MLCNFNRENIDKKDRALATWGTITKGLELISSEPQKEKTQCVEQVSEKIMAENTNLSKYINQIQKTEPIQKH